MYLLNHILWRRTPNLDLILSHQLLNLDLVSVCRIHFRFSCGSTWLYALLSLFSRKRLGPFQMLVPSFSFVLTVLIPSSRIHTAFSCSRKMKFTRLKQLRMQTILKYGTDEEVNKVRETLRSSTGGSKTKSNKRKASQETGEKVRKRARVYYTTRDD